MPPSIASAHLSVWPGSQDWRMAFDAVLHRTQSSVPMADSFAAMCSKYCARFEAAMLLHLLHENCRRSDTHAALPPGQHRRNRRGFEVTIKPDWRRYSDVATPVARNEFCPAGLARQLVSQVSLST